MFIEIQRGQSFKGVALYCLHDADRARSSERVAFAETRNLATSNPHVAWRIMAAQHFAQDELKRQAGIGMGGRKNGKPVAHMYLSWGQDEAAAQKLDRNEMLYSAKGALRAIGAQHYPAIIVAHTDTANPHCHVILSLIGPDGRLKSNWKEREKLSRFALKREIEVHGEAVVKLREKNWKHRLSGERTPTVKKKARQLWELDKAAQQDPRIAAFAKKHYQQLAELERLRKGHIDARGEVVQEGLQARQKRHRKQLHWCYQERLRKLKADTEKKAVLVSRIIQKRYDFAWQELLNRQEADRHEFRKNETTRLGRAYNILRYTDWKAVFLRQHQTGEKAPSIFSRAFNALSSSGHRKHVLDSRQQAEQEELRARQRRLKKAAYDRLKAEQNHKAAIAKAGYVRKSAAMKARQARGKTRLDRKLQQLTQQRNEILRPYREQAKFVKKLKTAEKARGRQTTPDKDPSLSDLANLAFSLLKKAKQQSDEAKSPVKAEQKSETKNKRTRKRNDPSERTNRRHTKAADLLPQEGSQQAAEQIDQHLENISQRLQEDHNNDKTKNQGKSKDEGHTR